MSNNDDEGVELEMDEPAKAETEKALLCVVNGKEYWVPKSQLIADNEVERKGDAGKLVVSTWWAEKNGLG